MKFEKIECGLKLCVQKLKEVVVKFVEDVNVEKSEEVTDKDVKGKSKIQGNDEV